MCVYVGAIVRDKRYPDMILGKTVFVNSQSQTAIVETAHGWSAVPLYMIETVNQFGGSYARS